MANGKKTRFEIWRRFDSIKKVVSRGVTDGSRKSRVIQFVVLSLLGINFPNIAINAYKVVPPSS
jgi:hypothetical protein